MQTFQAFKDRVAAAAATATKAVEERVARYTANNSSNDHLSEGMPFENESSALDGIEIEEDVVMPAAPAEPMVENKMIVTINGPLSDALNKTLNRVSDIISLVVTRVFKNSTHPSSAVDMTVDFAEWTTTLNALCERRSLEVLGEYQQEFTKLSTLSFQFGRLIKKARSRSELVNIALEVSPTATGDERTTLHDKFIADLGIFIQAVDRLSATAMTLCATSLAMKKEMDLNQAMRRRLGEKAPITLSNADIAHIRLETTPYTEENNISEALAEALEQVNLLQEAVREKGDVIIALENQLESTTEKSEQKSIKTKLENLNKALEPLQQELTAAVAAATEVRKADNARQAQIETEKQAKIRAAMEAREQEVEALQNQEKFFWEAYEVGCEFLTDYAKQLSSLESLTLTVPVQCALPDVRHTMLTAWLADLEIHLSQEDRQWLLSQLTPVMREFSIRLSETNEKLVIIFTDNLSTLMYDIQMNLSEVSPQIPVHSNVMQAGQYSVTQQIRDTYDAVVDQANSSAIAVIPGMKLGSDVSRHARDLLNEIRATTLEYRAHVKLANMHRNTLALFGVYVLLYLQDAPNHNFNNVTALSPDFPGGGGRFVFTLMSIVQKELGYQLRACKIIYDAMNKRTSIVEKVSENAQESSHKLSSDLAYLFEPCRTEEELSESKAKIILSKDDSQAHQILVDQLTKRYEFELKKLALAEGDFSEVDRKRIKRIVELMEQLPYEKRLPLMNSDVIQLFILRAQVASYERSSTGEKGSVLGSALGKGTRALLKATGVDRKKGKYEFFVAAFVYFKTKLEQAHSEFNETGDKREFSKNFFEAKIEGTELNSDREDIGTWLRKTILEGKDTPKALMWLSNNVLNELFAGSDIRAKTIREMQGTSEKAFNTISVSNNGIEKTIYNTSIESVNELFIVLACQAAILDFSKLMLETSNGVIIEIASQRSWFLQLRFLQTILIEKKILPIYDAQTSAPIYKRERDMLKVFDNMMQHISDLPDWVDACFSDARVDTRDAVSLKTNIEKTKLAFVLIAEFFSVIFSTLAIAAASIKDNAHTKFLINLAEHINDIKKMAGFALNGEYEAVLFGLAVNFLLENPVLLQSTAISNTFANGTISTIKNNNDALLDTNIYSSGTNIGLENLAEDKRIEILSNKKVMFFVTSPLALPPMDTQENILVNDAIHRLT